MNLPPSPPTDPNIDTHETDKFRALADTWWDLEGMSRPLHDINPTRLHYVANQTPLAGKHILDVGCGGGIFSESLCRMGATVTGIDATAEVIEVADAHAHQNGLAIDYHTTTAQAYAESHTEAFDVVTCLELIEHVPSPKSLVDACAHLLKPDGILVFSTLNRTLKSYLFTIVGAEYILNLLPKGTHQYDKFIQPAELSNWCTASSLHVVDIKGLSYHPFSRKSELTDNVSVNYFLTAKK